MCQHLECAYKETLSGPNEYILRSGECLVCLMPIGPVCLLKCAYTLCVLCPSVYDAPTLSVCLGPVCLMLWSDAPTGYSVFL